MATGKLKLYFGSFYIIPNDMDQDVTREARWSTSYQFDRLYGFLKVSADKVVEINRFNTYYVPEIIPAIRNKTFCLTGTLSDTRDNVEYDIHRAGGYTKRSVTGVDYLVAADPSDISEKLRTARRNGIQIINEDLLRKMIKAGN